jgi:formylglycine-generating enzyme required for sulfatase activity
MRHASGAHRRTGFPNRQGIAWTGWKTRPAAIRIAVALIWLLSASALAGEPSSKPAPPASQTEVPAALLARLRAQYIPEETKTPDVSESDKVRRYEAILREGGWAERQYAQAPNLHEVRELMMAAAKGMATLEGTVEARDLLLEIARRLVNSSAPPESRVVAEMLFVRARIDELAEYPAEAADEAAAFVARYRGTPGEPKALVGAAELCRIADADSARIAFLRQLSEKHFSAPGVSEFLESAGANPYIGRLMTARLRSLDGSVLTMPRDTLGKFTVVHFWSKDKSGLGQREANGVYNLMPIYKSLRDAGVQFVGVNLDTDLAQVADFVRDAGKDMDWTQTCSGLGLKDPTFLRYPVPALPAYWLIGPDGCAFSNNYLRGFREWPNFSNGVNQVVGQLGEMAVRAPYYRSGEFLLDLPTPAQSAPPGAADVPAGQLDELRRKSLLPPALGLGKDKKAAAFRETLELGRMIEQKHQQAANLPVVRSAMLVAARWLAVEAPDKAAAKQAQEIAARILESKAEGPARLLADYVRASDELAAGEISRQESARRIDALVEKYAGGELNWAAAILGVMLAAECGDEDSRTTLVDELRGYAERRSSVRGFLRDYCNVNIDARTTFIQIQPLPLPVGTAPPAVAGVLPLLGGGTLKLEDLKDKWVMIHFWSTACPAFTDPGMRGARGMTPDAAFELAVVGVNLDRSREEVEKYLSRHDGYKGWIHVFSGRGQDDPLARELDIYGLPRSVLLDRNGSIYRWGRPGQMPNIDYRMMEPRPKDRPQPARGGPKTAPGGPAPGTAEKAGTAEAAVDNLPKEISLDLGGKTAMKLALIAAGEFRMGSLPTDKGHFDDEEPARRRIFTKPFYMGVHHVTRGQFAAFVRQANYKTEAERQGWALLWNGAWQKVEGAFWRKCGFDQDDDHPVVCVSWNDAVEFCNWLGRTSGRTVRLPTEAQWEYACRAGTETTYPWGQRPEDGNGWCNAADLSAAGKFPGWIAFQWDDGYVFTSPVGKFKANACGLYDMTGNAWQWCSDWYEAHKPREAKDQAGPATGTYRVARGGSWNGGPDYCRSAVRRQEPPATSTNMVGFRVVVEAP